MTSDAAIFPLYQDQIISPMNDSFVMLGKIASVGESELLARTAFWDLLRHASNSECACQEVRDRVPGTGSAEVSLDTTLILLGPCI